ncbi:BMP/retinoic acid-inducible neural-specific protein 3-like isoform X1 [Acipenser oxyrinchus oxyrinchus]|uniref:BMP/retinoic acid-inducible neural-specific protein 3-like isoform X1 n=1 Tax=Acipenser oxyrinchus oxyrinchus TaxID=40147 RepID=A0AAD8D7Q6_ACIOX|nr:BMP/retinoic acid-inducible neural-specific protein 3-like isoform X1 [Acipenser oxyrinchus oxyrinchus]
MTWYWCGTAAVRWLSLMVLSEWTALSLHCWVLAVSTASGQHETSGPMDWLLSDKGPFYRSQEYTEFIERHQQGFTTRYKIYREFGRWKVNSLAVERRDFLSSPLPLSPEFITSLRLLGRRPSLEKITENIIKKYGTHLLLAATLGGEESLTIFVNKKELSKKRNLKEAVSNSSAATLETLHQLAASYFIDRESTLRRLHHLQIATSAIKVTETRTGPLGCSNYDNLDSVSSVLVQSPENKIHLQGLQVILPNYLHDRFVRAALGYITCNSEGDFICKDNDCWCQCTSSFPECNCPSTDIQAIEEKLLQVMETWGNYNLEFQDSDEFKSFVKTLPLDHLLNSSTIFHLWTKDSSLQRLYEQLEGSMRQLHDKAQKMIQKLFNLSKRCEKQPQYRLPRERPIAYWLKQIQSLLYCSENNLSGTFNEEIHNCTCPMEQDTCQRALPCQVGDSTNCLICAQDSPVHCSSCNAGYVLSQGTCRPEVADSLEHYLGLETDFQDLELKYLLQKRDSRVEVHAIFISNDMRLNSWFDPSWRKRMLLTLKSNKYRSNLIHMLLGLTVQICLTRNSTLEPVLSIYINPFGGSHSESWLLPVHENSFPDWERTTLEGVPQCTNWTMTLGNKRKSFFETVHIYLRSRIKATDSRGNETTYYEPLELVDPSRNLGYMKVNGVQAYGYSMHFDGEAIQDLILQLDYPYTQGSQHSALLQLVEIRDRVNMLSPPGKQHLDLFSCLLRHRLKLSASEVVRIQDSLQAFSAKLPHNVEYETDKLCS